LTSFHYQFLFGQFSNSLSLQQNRHFSSRGFLEKITMALFYPLQHHWHKLPAVCPGAGIHAGCVALHIIRCCHKVQAQRPVEAASKGPNLGFLISVLPETNSSPLKSDGWKMNQGLY